MSMDSSKIISLEDYTRQRNKYPDEEEGLDYALKISGLLAPQDGGLPLLGPRNIYIENDVRWQTAHPHATSDEPEALFRAGAVLHYLLTRSPFRISYYLDGPPAVRERNPQISVRMEAIVSRLLQNQRALRYPTVAELESDLQKLKKELTGDRLIHWQCFKGGGARNNFLAAPEWNPTGLTLKEIWKAPIGEIWASPVMAGESLYVGSGDGNFYSMDAATGKIEWKVSLGVRMESTPCLHRNVAYVGSDTGVLFAINLRNGSLLWKKSLGEYIRSSPYCDGANVYAGTISPEKKSGMLSALSLQNGSTVWKRSMGPVFSSPVVDQDRIFAGSDDEQFYCLDTSNGAVIWQTGLSGKIRSTAALSRDFLYVGGFGDVLYKIRRATGEIVWRSADAGSMYSSPAAGKGIVAVGNNAGAVQFFQINNGKRKGIFSTGGPVTGSVLLVNQYALIGSNDGHFYILDTMGQEICSFDARAPINSSAFLHNDRIFFGSDQGLHALSL